MIVGKRKFSTPAPFTGNGVKEPLERDRPVCPAPPPSPAYGRFTTVSDRRLAFRYRGLTLRSISDSVALAATSCGVRRFESHCGNEPL